MTDQNGGGLLDEVMGAVESMMGGTPKGSAKGDKAKGSKATGGGLLNEVIDAVGSDKINELKDDVMQRDMEELKKDVVESVKSGAAKVVEVKIRKEVKENLGDGAGNLLEGLLGGDK